MTTELDNPARVGKVGILGWMLFDWAAQPYHTMLVTFVFARYFAAEVAPDPTTAQIVWSWMLTAAGIAIALLSPVLGSVADATGPRKPWMLFFSVLAVCGSAMLWTVTPDSPMLPALVFFAIAMIGFEFAAVFNNAVMPDLVPREELGRLSGNGWAMGYLGGLISLLILLLLMLESSPGSGFTLIGQVPLFGLTDVPSGGERSSGPFAAIWYVLFVLPFFLYTPDSMKRERVAGAIRKGLGELYSTIKDLPNSPSLFAYLVSSMFYRDALNGLFTFGGIYAAGVLGWSATQLGVFGISTLVTGIFGAWIGGKFDDKFGPKAVIVFSIVILIAVCVTIVTTTRDMVLLVEVVDNNSGFAPADIAFYICGMVIGAMAGPLQAASRTLMADQAKEGQMAEAFGLYALSGKATSFLAPMLIGLVTYLSGSQNIGVAPLVVLFLIGLFLLPFVKEKRG